MPATFPTSLSCKADWLTWLEGIDIGIHIGFYTQQAAGGRNASPPPLNAARCDIPSHSLPKLPLPPQSALGDVASNLQGEKGTEWVCKEVCECMVGAPFRAGWKLRAQGTEGAGCEVAAASHNRRHSGLCAFQWACWQASLQYLTILHLQHASVRGEVANGFQTSLCCCST